MNYQTVFPTAVSGSLYFYDLIYVPESVLSPGTGYWVNLSDSTSAYFLGENISEMNTLLDEGWNLIGTISEEAVLSDPGGVTVPGSLYGFQGGYQLVSTLQPTQGYWIAAADTVTVSIVPVGDGGDGDGGGGGAVLAGGSAQTGTGGDLLDDSGRMVPTTFEPLLHDLTAGGFHALKVFAEDQMARTLYFGGTLQGEYHPLQLSLPPVPPRGSLDARLAGGRWLVESGEETEGAGAQPSGETAQGAWARVELQQNGEPLHVAIEGGAAEYELIFTDGYNELGRATLSPMTPGTLDSPTHAGVDSGSSDSSSSYSPESVEVPLNATVMLVSPVTESEQEEIPSAFVLEQNYPNPFNPTTQISYALPEDSNVRLEVFNMLGQRVAMLVDASRQQAGRYNISFDASGLSSGVYIYRLTARSADGTTDGDLSTGDGSTYGSNSHTTGVFTQTRKMMLMK